MSRVVGGSISGVTRRHPDASDWGHNRAASAKKRRLNGAVRSATSTPAAVSPAALGLAVGAYVMALAVILTTLATGLARGLDRSLVGYRVGRALSTASVVFVAGLVGTGWLV